MEREGDNHGHQLAAAVASQAPTSQELMSLLYRPLRELAAAYMAAERRNHTLQPTALVHEAYLRLTELTDMRWRDKTHFFAAAAITIRRVLVDHAKRHDAKKRGAGRTMLELSEGGPTAVGHSTVDVVDLDEALCDLAEKSPRQARIVELRFFGGLEIAEVAAIMGISERTVYNEWSYAKAWLAVRLKSYAHEQQAARTRTRDIPHGDHSLAR